MSINIQGKPLKDWVEEQKEIIEYLSYLDLYEEVTVSVPHSKVEELMKFVDNL